MIVTNNTPPVATIAFSALPSGPFVRGAGNVAYIKTTDGQAIRLADHVVDASVLPTDQVREAPSATVSMFPPA